jgi:hypothetical protein
MMMDKKKKSKLEELEMPKASSDEMDLDTSDLEMESEEPGMMDDMEEGQDSSIDLSALTDEEVLKEAKARGLLS